MEINKRRVIRVFALTFLVMSIAMIPSLICAIIDKHTTMILAFAIPATLMFISGSLVLKFVSPSTTNLKIRDGYMGIFLAIIISAIVGAIPYMYGIPAANFVDAIFESTAGLSTTSATVFYEPAMNDSLILWKAVEHWIGGLAVLIFVISILPILGAGDQQIATAEAHGSYQNKIAPRSITIVYYTIFIYVALTILAFVYFSFAKIGLFDTFILALSTSSTSGVLLHPEGISYYNSFYVEMGVSIFCILSSINFVMYIHLYKRHFTEIKKNIELRAFLFIIVISTIVIGIILFMSNDNSKDFLESMRDSFFQVSSFATTSGFALENYTLWPAPCCFLLISLMIIGGCSASTTGSFKVIRLLIVLKLISRGFVKRIHPRAVKTVSVGNSKISAKMVSSVTTFSILYFFTLIFSTIVLSFQNLDIESTFSATLGAISNDGISFGAIGMAGDYSIFHPILKIFLSFLMIVGRLGLLTVFIVFLPSFWNPNRRTRIQ